MLLGFVSISLGQFSITFPLNRAVFQRNNAGIATITVTGIYQQQVDRIEARVTIKQSYAYALSPLVKTK